MDAIVANLAAITQDLKNLTHDSSDDLEATLSRISEMTDKISRGEGTVGRLINDDSTVDKANTVLDNLSDITQSYFSMQTQLGWHLEYLGRAGTAKNYVDIRIKPRPDKFFQFSVVHDPNPPGSTSFETEIFNTNGTITTVEKETTDFDKTRFSAQLGKQFDDFTVRGGLIESTGGFGVDYTKGPVEVKVEAFDFGDGNTHLKATSQLNVTRSLFVVGGVDNPTGQGQNGQADYFFGGGLRFTDEDINSLFGGAALILGR
jgi:phospholipid/cholesterol/gamma-HCH transport system substrate-binding protein